MARVALTDDNGALYGAPATWLGGRFVPQTPEPLTISLSTRNTAPVDIVMVGDSSTEGAGASRMEKNYVSQVARAAASAYNPVGVPGGTACQAYSSISTAENGWTITGTTTITEGGLAGQVRTLGAGAAMSRTEVTTGVTVLFEGTAAPFTVTLDDAAPIEVIPEVTQQTWSSPSLVDGEHTVTITAPDGGVSIGHVYFHRNDRDYGVRVWNAGKGSSRMSHWVGSRASTQRAAMAALAPDGITLMMGTNDLQDGTTAATFGTQVEQWIDGMVTALGYTPWIGLLGQFDRTNWTDAQRTTWGQMKAEMERIATARSYVTYHDVSRGFSTDNTDPYDLVGPDQVHLVDRGYALTASNILESLGVPARTTAVVPAAVAEPLPVPFVDLYNTVALFDADKITATDGTAISSWAPYKGSQTAPANATGAQPPVLRKSYVNGQASMQFFGGASTLKTAAWTNPPVTPLTVLSVHWIDTTNTNNAAVFSNVTNAAGNLAYMQHINSTGAYSAGAGGTNQLSTPSVARGQWVVTATVFDAAGSRLYANRRTPVTGTANAATMDALLIGQSFAGSSPFSGHIPYLRICAQALTQAQVETELNDLGTRYGVTIAA